MIQQLYSLHLPKKIWKLKGTWMFTVDLFITAKPWKQANIPSNSEWIKTAVESDNGILSNHEKPWRNIKKYIAKWEKLVWKGYVLYDPNYMTSWKR